MSVCGICGADIDDGKPCDWDHQSYDGCESNNEINDYVNR